MPLEPEVHSRETLGPLRVCLIDGDAEQRTRERKVRRRALALSICLQTVFLAAVLIVPLLAKTPPLTLPNFVPIPPYAHPSVHEQSAVRQRTRRNARPEPCRFCPPNQIPPNVAALPPDTPPPPGDYIATGQSQGASPAAGLNVFDLRPQPPAPRTPQQHRIAQGGKVQAAMLVYRAQPVYPTLMLQIRKSGRVELHAVIATDGTVQSLQVISGDPGFYQSALDAVRQWRYRPTILNGQAVEVETTITVIYNIE